jgi:hypothetical protein
LATGVRVIVRVVFVSSRAEPPYWRFTDAVTRWANLADLSTAGRRHQFST